MHSASAQAISKVSALKWLMLVALAWSQLTLAAHDIRHHTADELDEVCEACLQIDRDGDVLTDPDSISTQSITSVSAGGSLVPGRPIEGLTRFRARASP